MWWMLQSSLGMVMLTMLLFNQRHNEAGTHKYINSRSLSKKKMINSHSDSLFKGIDQRAGYDDLAPNQL